LDIREEVDTFMFEGHDTTSSGIAFCLYNLAKYPEIQQKAFDEIRSVIGDDANAAITMKELNEMKYLEMVIKETLRLYPSVAVYGRKLKEDIDFSNVEN
jgi:cytochrome P450 family 4